MRASSPPRPSPSRVPPSPSPSSSRVADLHNEPLNRLAQVSKMIQKAREGALLEAPSTPAAGIASSGTDEQKEHPDQSEDADAGRSDLTAPPPTGPTVGNSPVPLELSSHEVSIAPLNTVTPAALATSASSLPQVHWGFGSRPAAAVKSVDPRELSASEKFAQDVTGEHQSTSIAASAPHVANPVSWEPGLQFLSAAAPEPEVDARPNAKSPSASSCVSPSLQAVPDSTPIDMLDPPLTLQDYATNASASGNPPAADHQLKTGCTPQDRHDWGSFGLSVLESQDSVPVWDSLPRQPAVPFTPSGRANASSVALSESQTQSQSDDSQGASDCPSAISRPETGPAIDEIPVPSTQRATYFLGPGRVDSSHENVQEASLPGSQSHSVQKRPQVTSTPLSQLFTPVQEGNDEPSQRLQRSPTFTASAETLGERNPLRWDAGGETGSSPSMSQTSACNASSNRDPAASGSPAPRLEAGWSVAVNPGGSWEDQGTSSSSPKPSRAEYLVRATPAAALPLMHVDESLAFLLNSPAPSLPGDGPESASPREESGVSLRSPSARTPPGAIQSDAAAMIEDGPSEAEQARAKDLFETADETFSSRHEEQDVAVDEDMLEVERSTQTAESTSQSSGGGQHSSASASVPGSVSNAAKASHDLPHDSSAAVWRAAEAQSPIPSDSRRRSKSLLSLSRRRKPAVRQVMQVMIPPAPKRRGKSTLICDGRVPSSVKRANAWQQKMWFALLQASDSEEESEGPVVSTSAVPLKRDPAAVQRKPTSAPGTAEPYVPSRSTLSVNKKGLGKDRQSRLVFSKARPQDDESWRPTNALPVSMPRRKRGRPRLDKQRHDKGKQAVLSSSDEAPEDMRRSRRQPYPALPNRSSREHARALTRSLIQEQESDSDDEVPRPTGHRSQAVRRPPQQVLLDEEDESQRDAAASESVQLNRSAAPRRSASAVVTDAAGQRSDEEQRQTTPDSGDESSAPVLVGIRQAEKEVPCRVEATVEITSSGSVRGVNEVIEISEDSVSSSQPAVASPRVAVQAATVHPAQVSRPAVVGPSSPRRQKLAAVEVSARQAPRLLTIQPGISTLEALKRLRQNAGQKEPPSGNNGNESSTTESVESIAKAATTAPRLEASADDRDDLRILREEQAEIRQEQAWLAEQRKAAQASGSRCEEEEGADASDSWHTSAGRTAETEADSWAEPRPQRGERSADRAGRGEKELMPLGKFVGELLQHAQTTGKQAEPGTSTVRSLPQQAAERPDLANQTSRGALNETAPATALLQGPGKRPATNTLTPALAKPTGGRVTSAAGSDGTEGQKRKAPSAADHQSDGDGSSPVSKRPRVDREEGRRRLARLLQAIGD